MLSKVTTCWYWYSTKYIQNITSKFRLNTSCNRVGYITKDQYFVTKWRPRVIKWNRKLQNRYQGKQTLIDHNVYHVSSPRPLVTLVQFHQQSILLLERTNSQPEKNIADPIIELITTAILNKYQAQSIINQSIRYILLDN